MTERDHWTERLHCPACEVTDKVDLSQANAASDAYHAGEQNVRVEIAPTDFRTAISDHGCQFYCDTCGALADHLT